MKSAIEGEPSEADTVDTDEDASSRPALTIVIPAYNEAENLEELDTQIRESIDGAFDDWEIVYVDDGSSDGTYELLQSLAAEYSNVRVVKFWRNFGKANALAAGFDNARGELIATMDADLQDDPSIVPDLADRLEEGYDLVSGWRYDRQSPLLKRKSSQLYNTLTARLTGLELHDLNCGLKIYRREVLEQIDVYGGLHRYIPVLAYWQGFRVGEMKVPHRPRKHGSSKYKTRRLANGFFDLLSVTFLTKYSRTPLRVFGGLGTISTGLGFVVGVYLLYLKYVVGQGIGTRPLLSLSVLLLVVGVQFFSLGFLAEKVTANTRNKPYYELVE